MINRWTILAVLFFARLTMGMQYQSIAAVSPLVIEAYAVTLADVGFMIGLYLGPGILVAIPGSTIAARLGEKRVVAAALFAMLLGGLMIAVFPGWTAALVGRVLAGVGGVVINVVMTKMLVDWFADREIATALGIFITSWPAGIALALLVLPNLAVNGGLGTVWLAICAIIAVTLAAFLAIYQSPPITADTQGSGGSAAVPFGAILAAGLLWGIFNAALAMLFSFGPLILERSGLDLNAASQLIGYLIMAVGIGTPLGGIISDRTGRRDTVIATGVSVAAILMPLLLIVPQQGATALYLLTGLIFGITAGPIMSVPSALLSPSARALGMGIFFAIYYAAMLGAPTLAGAVAERSGRVETTYWLGAGMLVICLGLLAYLRKRRPA